MRAYLLDNPQTTLSREDLEAEGFLYWQLPTGESEYEGPLAKVRIERGYHSMDVVALSRETPGFDNLTHKFFREHLHDDEEIRFVVEGAGIFDLRNRADQWVRIHVEPGDLLIVPPNTNHRFCLDDQQKIVCKRLFQSVDGWEAVFRHQDL